MINRGSSARRYLICIKARPPPECTISRMKITFLGAAREVTGSCFMVEAAGARFLVDHGMFQGLEADRRNRVAPAFDPGDIGFVLLTHAHIDHSGLLPRLARQGFRGPV